METKEIGNYYVEVIEERSGVKEDDQGFINPTYNMYAGIGYELDDDDKCTGKIIAWAGNNADGSVDEVDTEDLDQYLLNWNDDWPTDFRSEGLIS